jgi:hypothetical protein
MASKLNIGKLWTKEEENELKNEYVNKNLTIDEIAGHHKRFTGGILARLKKLNLLREVDEEKYELEIEKKKKENDLLKDSKDDKNMLKIIEMLTSIQEQINELKEIVESK